MNADTAEQTRPATTQRPWRLKRRMRTPRSLAPPPPRSRIRAMLVVAVLSGSTLAGALGATAIGGKRAEAAPTPAPIAERPPDAHIAQIAPVAFEARSETTVIDGSAKAASVESSASSTRRKSARVEDGRLDHSALGVRARPLSERERLEMGAGAPAEGWKVISAASGARLRRADVIVGACGSGAQPPLRAVMSRLVDDSKITRCLVVLRNGEAIRVGPGETGPSP
jgi:hypothetical protein